MRTTTSVAVSFLMSGLMSVTYADSGFLDDYSKLKEQSSAAGTDLVYVAPDAFEQLAKSNEVMVDQPEVLISPDSEYKGAKPDDLRAISELMRSTISERLKAGGHNVVEQPGRATIYLRLGLTDLYLKKKKRNVLGYTPVGFVVKAGVDAVQSMMDNVDIIEMTLEAEIQTGTGEQLGALVIKRGARKAAGQKEQRIDFDEFRQTIGVYASRLRCRLDNAKLPEGQRADCLAVKQ